MWDETYLYELREKRKKAGEGGGASRADRQHTKGKMTARERLCYLFDENSFQEIGSFMESRCNDFDMEKKKTPGDGVITGFGTIQGRPAYAAAQDFTVLGGTLGESHSKKIARAIELASESKVPFISINDSGGARIEEGIMGLNGYGDIFSRHVKASGKIPQIAVIMGPCAGGACYSPALCDFVFMVDRTSQMFLTGPGVVKSVLGEETSAEDLGGAQIHSAESGVAHFHYGTEQDCLDGVKRLLSYLPGNCRGDAVMLPGTSRDNSLGLKEIVPDNQRKAYDVRSVIDAFTDEGSFFEVHKDFGMNIVTGFARMDSDVLGIIASQPAFLGGALDIDASEKAARFVRFCDCFGIPLLTLIDVPGFMPGKKMEREGIIRRGAKLLYAYCEASVPKVSLIMRKAYGGAYIAMCSKGVGADIVYAWPIAQIAVMGAEGAVDILFKHEIETAQDKKKVTDQRTEEYNKKFMSPYIAAELGMVDEIIEPGETKQKLKRAFEILRNKERRGTSYRHGNIPL